VIQNKQVRPFCLLSGRRVRWPRRMLPPGESRWVRAASPITVRKKDGTDRQTDARPLHDTYS